MATWFRRRRTPDDRTPDDRTPDDRTPAVYTTVDAARFRPDRVPRPLTGRPPLLVAGAGHNPPVFRHDGRLPFGVAVYPDTSTLCEPWFGGPTPAPQRIIPGRQAIDEAGES